jgi:hypothetical protein
MEADLPQAFFVRSLNCAVHGDFQGALEAHHRYFDFSARHGGPNNNNSKVVNGGIFSSSKSNKDKIAMRIQLHVAQHAVLNKARIHFQVPLLHFLHPSTSCTWDVHVYHF